MVRNTLTGLTYDCPNHRNDKKQLSRYKTLYNKIISLAKRTAFANYIIYKTGQKPDKDIK